MTNKMCLSLRFNATIMAVLSASCLVFAKTDVSQKIAQLKENADASKANLREYEDGLSIVIANIRETERALKALDRQKTALQKQVAATAQGKKAVDAGKQQLDGFMKAERAKLEAELKQIDELKLALAQLEGNVKKREETIAHYQGKMSKLDGEMMNWSERNDSINELQTSLDKKEAEAGADLAKYKEKRAAFEEEVAKWRKQVRVSERMYANFSSLKD